ncbi:Zinc finger protein 615 [Araneus ventricosus]|uniref:Zinc finger protein 615 n=1 Tax=Araneus ventricosus TaxID=182803 RepID=A0A4Y2SZ48_ARAVE|nr:Zinc finger protein 615 [Araneus ventricosus]
MESDKLSGELTDGPISYHVASHLSSRNEEMAVNVMETPDTSENANVVAGPSGMRPCLLKQAEKTGFVCGLCHKEFAGSWEFYIHYRRHTGEKPFICEVCKRGFTRKGDLDRHYRTHTSQKRFVCDICEKGYCLKFNLEIHYRTHTSEKLFVCGICQKGFTRRVHLDNHYRTHNDTKYL